MVSKTKWGIALCFLIASGHGRKYAGLVYLIDEFSRLLYVYDMYFM